MAEADNYDEDIFADLYDDDNPGPTAVEAPSAAVKQPEPPAEPVPTVPDVIEGQPPSDPSDDTLMNDTNGDHNMNGSGTMNGAASDEHGDMHPGDEDSYGPIGMKEDG